MINFKQTFSIKKDLWIFLLFSISLSFLLKSCTDTYGTDPEVKITSIGTNTNDTSKKDTNFITQINVGNKWKFTEYFENGPKHYSFTWGNQFNEIRKSFKIDTTFGKIAFWIDYEVQTTVPDEYFNLRRDRIISFRITIDSLFIGDLKESRNYALINGFRSEIQIKDIIKNQKYTINNNDLGCIFTIRKVPFIKNYEGSITFDIFPFFKYQTYKFHVNFEAEIP